MCALGIDVILVRAAHSAAHSVAPAPRTVTLGHATLYFNTTSGKKNLQIECIYQQGKTLTVTV